MRRMAACLAAMVLTGAAEARAERVCVEELAGTCLKYEERAAATAPARIVSPAESAERALGLDEAARRRVQAALNRAGFAAGTPDGAFGARTRQAIAAWQQANGRSPSGFLGASDVTALLAAPEPAPAPQSAPAATPPAAPAPAVSQPAPAAQPLRLTARTRLGPARFDVSAEGAAGGRAVLTLEMETISAPDRFRQSCDVPATGSFSCMMHQSGWKPVRVRGALPEVEFGFDARTLVVGDPNAQDSPSRLELTLR